MKCPDCTGSGHKAKLVNFSSDGVATSPTGIPIAKAPPDIQCPRCKGSGQKPQRGGARAGAGSPTVWSSKTRTVSMTLPEDLLDVLDEVSETNGTSRSKLVAGKLSEVFELELLNESEK